MKAILGVTGCIAAYKSAQVLRLLQTEGFEVLPVMTRHAERFIGSLTLEKLSGNHVLSDLFQDRSAEIEHIALARRSDILAVAPATANILAKFAHGIADDFLSTLYVSTTTPVVVAPAMNVEMWRHPATQANLALLRERDVTIVEPQPGYLACGEVGEGRLAEPEEIVRAMLSRLPRDESLKGRRVLVTAGPTIEDIDPVRFISNRSSGKMGYAVAQEAVRRGAEVVLVSGPTALDPPSGAEFIAVRSAAQLESEVLERSREADIVVMAAAVGDYTPEERHLSKLKKSEGGVTIALKRTTDVLKTLGERKNGRFLVGFAAESENLLENARSKLRDKNLDLIVANDITIEASGFQSESNQVALIPADGPERELPLMPKPEVARIIWDEVAERLQRQFVAG